MKLLIKNGRVIDPGNKIDGIRDILVENGRITEVSAGIEARVDNTIDAKGKIVMPGIVDMHVHLREPGREDKETVASATAAALRGGVTSLLAMPNTQPCIDSADSVKLLKEIIDKTAKSHVFICGAITKERKGEKLSAISELKKEGAVAISDDGVSVDKDDLMRQALKAGKEQDLLVISHCEDRSLCPSGVVNLGIISTRLGLRGISRESEYKRVQRDLELAQKTGARIHIAHVSCKESVDLVAQYKKKGVKVTAEVTPHHFSLTEDALLGFDTNMKMNPPLRRKEDRDALKEGLKSGVIDVIASDHAPHTENEKEIEFERAEFGVIGLETELAASVHQLIKTGLLDWPDLAQKMCLNPAKILGINKGSLGIGRDADIIIISPEKEWAVKKEEFLSSSKNSPFLGWKLTGLVEYCVVSGSIAYKSPG